MASEQARPIRIEELLDHASWLRRLALQLAGGRADLADDAVQDAWVAALERPHEPRRSPRQWLAQVVRNALHQQARSEAARKERERSTARPEALDSAESAVEHAQALRLLVEELLALDEPYRSTLLLRFQNGLRAEEIARAQGVPAATVRSRALRGLSLLRERLERRDGTSLQLALAPLLGVRAPSTHSPHAHSGPAPAGVAASSVPLAVGFLSMTKLVSSAVAALALVALAWWAWSGREITNEPLAAGSPPTPSELVVTAAPTEDARTRRVALAESAPIEQTASAAPSTSTGSLRVHVTWGSDGTNAEGVHVSALSIALGPTLVSTNLRTCDADGKVVFDALLPGEVTLVHDRGDSIQVEVRANEARDVELAIPAGIEVLGHVVDERGESVAGARISIPAYGVWESGWEVATSDANGHFHLRDVGVDRMLAARAKDHSPSAQRRVPGKAGERAEVTLALRGPPCVVEGVVLTPQGSPFAGAEILLGNENAHGLRDPDGGFMESGPAVGALSDAAGRFRVEGIEPGINGEPDGSQPIAVRAKGFAPWWSEIELAAGETTRVTAQLGFGAAIDGVVLDAQGRPAAGVQVTAESDRFGSKSFLSRSATTRADGRFALTDLEPRETELVASAKERGSASARLALEANVTTRWEAQLVVEGGRVAGRVVDELGAPLAGWAVGAIDPRFTAYHERNAITDEQGKFALENWPASATALGVREADRWMGPPALVVNEVEIGREDLVLVVDRARAASAFVTGRIVGPDGRPVAGAALHWTAADDDVTNPENADLTHGAFRFGPIPPGEYELAALAPGFGRKSLGVRTLARDATLDLGTIALDAAGRVHVVLTPPEGVTPAPDWRVKGALLREVESDARSSLKFEGLEATSDPLAPGTYELTLHATGFRVLPAQLEIEPGNKIDVEVAIERATWRMAQLSWQDGTEAPRSIEYTLVDPDGVVIGRGGSGAGGSGGLETTLWKFDGLGLGLHTLSMRANDGRKATVAFDVTTLDAPEREARVQVPLR